MNSPTNTERLTFVVSSYHHSSESVLGYIDYKKMKWKPASQLERPQRGIPAGGLATIRNTSNRSMDQIFRRAFT